MDNFIKLTKCWNTREGSYGEKDYYFNPKAVINGIEPCKVKCNGNEVECTKILYSESNFITLKGSPEEIIKICQDANIVACVMGEMKNSGLSIKEFIKQIEGLNQVSV